jgi:hypothetical protein
MTRIAVALFHGIGCKGRLFGDEMTARLAARLAGRNATRDPPAATFVFKPIVWSHVMQSRQDALCDRLGVPFVGRWPSLRRLVVDWLGDALSYEPTAGHTDVYDAVHACVAQQLAELAAEAGATAPLCVIAHSFGSIVAANYFRDLHAAQQSAGTQAATDAIASRCAAAPAESALASGRTLAMMITLGSPLGLWSLRRPTTGAWPQVPAASIAARYPDLEGLWLNIYSPSDVLAYPLEKVHGGFAPPIVDFPVRLRGLLTSWNPLSHFLYWRDDVVTDSIAAALTSLARVASTADQPSPAEASV